MTTISKPADDPVKSPAHYTGYPVQPIEITRHLGFCLGNAVKYVLRAPFKGGVEDCEKALQYLEWEAEQHKQSRFAHTLKKEQFSDFMESLGYQEDFPPESQIVWAIDDAVIPSRFACPIVNFLLEANAYLFVEADHPESGLIGMEAEVCYMIDVIDGLVPGSTSKARGCKVWTEEADEQN